MKTAGTPYKRAQARRGDWAPTTRIIQEGGTA